MKLLVLLLALGACSTTSAALRAPWTENAAYNPSNRREPSRVHAAPQRRASDTPPPCPDGQYLLDDICVDEPDCLTRTTSKVDPVSKRMLSADRSSSSGFSGEVLDAKHTVKFLLSSTGSFTHDNGTTYHDHEYYRRRQARLAQRASQGLISRMAARSLTAFVKVAARSYIDRRIVDMLTQKDTLFVFSPNTAADTANVDEIVELILAEPDWTSFTMGAIKVEREAVEHLQDVLAGRATLDE